VKGAIGPRLGSHSPPAEQNTRQDSRAGLKMNGGFGINGVGGGVATRLGGTTPQLRETRQVTVHLRPPQRTRPQRHVGLVLIREVLIHFSSLILGVADGSHGMAPGKMVGGAVAREISLSHQHGRVGNITVSGVDLYHAGTATPTCQCTVERRRC